MKIPPFSSIPPSSILSIGGQYNPAPPTPAAGQFVPLQTDSNGNLLVNVVAGGSEVFVELGSVRLELIVVREQLAEVQAELAKLKASPWQRLKWIFR